MAAAHDGPERGLLIEKPSVLVPWEITEAELVSLFSTGALRHVVDGYYTAPCTSMGGLEHMTGFHFQPRRNGELSAFELFRSRGGDLNASYDEFQRHLESSYGAPHEVASGTEGRPTCLWRFGAVEIVHLILDRFGREEHLRLRKLASGA